jgi:uncharacterized membrane protein (DUF4010 family)
MVLALGEKKTIRRFVQRIGDVEMKAALQFAVLALVVLPLLPEGPYGPGGVIRPRGLWSVVLLFSGLNFIGYLVRRAAGEARGYPIAGALGGLVSSTATTLQLSRRSQSEPEHSSALALGTVAACVVLIPRVLVVIMALNQSFAIPAALALGPMFLAGVAIVWIWWRRRRADEAREELPSQANPLELGAAVKMAIAFQVVLILLELARDRFGDAGVFVGAALVGLTDVDALTLSMSRLASEPGMLAIATQALVTGIVSNTVLKSSLALVLGSGPYRRQVVPALLGLGLVGAAGWWIAALTASRV